jgi:hypothetical protein
LREVKEKKVGDGVEKMATRKKMEKRPSAIEKRNMFIKFVTCTNPATEKMKDDSFDSDKKSDISEKSGEGSVNKE